MLSQEQASVSSSCSMDKSSKIEDTIKCADFPLSGKIVSLPKSNTEIETNLCSQEMNQKRSKPKRPDMKLYVPRARRTQCAPDIGIPKENCTVEQVEICGKTKKLLTNKQMHSSGKSPNRKQHDNCDKEKFSSVQDCNQIKNIEFNDKDLTIADNLLNSGDKGSRSSKENLTDEKTLNEILAVQKLINEISTDSETKLSDHFCENESPQTISSISNSIQEDNDENIFEGKELKSERTPEQSSVKEDEVLSDVSKTISFDVDVGNNDSEPCLESIQFTSNELHKPFIDGNLSKESIKEEKEMNEIKNESDLKLKDCAEEEKVTEENKKSNNDGVFPPKTSDSKQENTDDSWDAMFDDSGECLNPDILKELTTAVGNVKINKSKYNYLEFQPHEPDVSGEEYGHIVEFYDFPVDFKNQDLMAIFSTFKNQGFNIKWVDDTHALGVFSSPLAAMDALNLKHPLLKVRPLSQGIRESKFKAKRCAEFLQPYRPRPETSATLARRLVSGALGVRLNVPKEQRELERQQLKEARDRRRQAAKQKRDIWNGVVS